MKFRIMGIAVLMAATSGGVLPKPAQAQNACSIASTQVRGSFDGIELSAKQIAASDAIGKQYDADVISQEFEKAKRIVKPNAMVAFLPKQGVQISPELQQSISVAASSTKPMQIATLTAKYGKYGRFIPETTLVYDQALFNASQKRRQDYQNRTLALMNPAQQRRYLQNQATIERSDKACGILYGPFTKVGNTYEQGGFYY